MGIWEQLGIGELDFGFGVVGTTVMVTFLAILLAGITWLAIWLIYRHLSYNQVVKVYGLVGNRPSLKFITKGKFVPIGKAGDRALRVKKPKGKQLITTRKRVISWQSRKSPAP